MYREGDRTAHAGGLARQFFLRETRGPRREGARQTTQMNEHARVAEFIRLLRTTDPRWFKDTFTNGACYRLYEILHHVWPEAEAWMARWVHKDDMARCHIYTRIGDRYYDIKGWHKHATIWGATLMKECGQFRRVEPADVFALSQMVDRRLSATCRICRGRGFVGSKICAECLGDGR